MSSPLPGPEPGNHESDKSGGSSLLTYRDPSNASSFKTPTKRQVHFQVDKPFGKPMKTVAEATQTLTETQSACTPFGRSTHSKMAKKAKVENVKEGLLEELGVIQLVDDASVRDLYNKLVPASKITSFLEDPNSGYQKASSGSTSGSATTGRWHELPVAGCREEDIYKPLISIIDRILHNEELCGVETPGVTREVVKTDRVPLYHTEDAEDNPDIDHDSRPDICIKATGPSFQVPLASEALPTQRKEGVGFSNVATVFDVKTDKAAPTKVKEDGSQVASYARQAFIQQPNRNFFRSLIITETSVRLYHFDRSGCFMSPFINFHQDPYTFVRLVVGLSCKDEHTLGLDTRVMWQIDESGRKVSGTITLSTVVAEPSPIKKRKPLTKTTITRTYDLDMTKPPFILTSVRGSGETWWYAKDRSACPRAVIVKDVWRNVKREHESRYLQAAIGVAGVAQYVNHQNTLAQTKTYRPHPLEREDYYNRIKCRVVMDVEGCRRLEDFKSRYELIAAILDVIRAHEELLLRGILHRSITKHGIVLREKGAPPGYRGAFVGMDMAIYIGRRKKEIVNDRRAGSLFYQSSLVVQWSYDESPPPQDHMDDLESIFWVLLRITMEYRSPGVLRSYQWPSFDGHNYDVGLAKEAFISAIHRPSGWWGKPVRTLIEGYRAILAPIIIEKRRIYQKPLSGDATEGSGGDDDSDEEGGPSADEIKARRLEGLKKRMNSAYTEVKALFEKALVDIQRDDAERAVLNAALGAMVVGSGQSAPAAPPAPIEVPAPRVTRKRTRAESAAANKSHSAEAEGEQEGRAAKRLRQGVRKSTRAAKKGKKK